MTLSQQTPVFCDVARYFAYPVKQTAAQNFVQITVAGGSQFGSITLKPQNYFVAYALTAFTNYDNVGGPIVSTANSSAILPRTFAPNNFTVKIERGNSNDYSNLPMPQAQACSSGYRAGKIFPYPVTYGPRSEFQFTFQDTTGLFLQATVGGSAVPLNIYAYLVGYNVPMDKWDKFCRLYPDFANVFGAPPSL